MEQEKEAENQINNSVRTKRRRLERGFASGGGVAGRLRSDLISAPGGSVQTRHTEIMHGLIEPTGKRLILWKCDPKI